MLCLYHSAECDDSTLLVVIRNEWTHQHCFDTRSTKREQKRVQVSKTCTQNKTRQKKYALCVMRNAQKVRAWQSQLSAQVSFLSLCDTHDATEGNGSFTQRCTESSSEKLKWLLRGGTGMAFFSFALDLCLSLLSPEWMPLWVHLGVRSEAWCCITVFSHVGITETFWMSARVGLSGCRCFLSSSLNHKRHLRGSGQRESVQLERQSIALSCRLI